MTCTVVYLVGHDGGHHRSVSIKDLQISSKFYYILYSLIFCDVKYLGVVVKPSSLPFTVDFLFKT